MAPSPALARTLRGLATVLSVLGLLVTVIALALGVVGYVAAARSGHSAADAVRDATRALLVFGFAGAWLFAPALLAWAFVGVRQPRWLFTTALAGAALTVALAVVYGFGAAVDKPAMLPSIAIMGAAAAVGVLAGLRTWRGRPPFTSP
ncbi:MAG TPA: hypothetical protein VI997_11430 [Candidatus Thermoplasmatota archaeon]|nr:hypothetical protein [Candidatus Thermoplasmatota archaeon]